MWSIDGVSARGVPGRGSTRRMLSWQIPQIQLSRSPIWQAVSASTGPEACILPRRREPLRRFATRAAWPRTTSTTWQGHFPASGRASPQYGHIKPITASLTDRRPEREFPTCRCERVAWQYSYVPDGIFKSAKDRHGRLSCRLSDNLSRSLGSIWIIECCSCVQHMCRAGSRTAIRAASRPGRSSLKSKARIGVNPACGQCGSKMSMQPSSCSCVRLREQLCRKVSDSTWVWEIFILRLRK